MVEQVLRLPAVGNLAHGQLVYNAAFFRQCRQHRVSYAAMRVVIFHRDHHAATCVRRHEERMMSKNRTAMISAADAQLVG